MDTNDPFADHLPKPTLTRPLLGLTILVVEDSRYACEAMRLLCLRSGARIRRADCLRAARRHLQVYRPSIVIVDLGLPDGNGEDLIEELTRVSPRASVVLGASGDSSGEVTAINSGADGFLPKPITSLAAFQSAILSLLPDDRRPMGPRSVTDEVISPDLIAFQDDMSHIADVLEEMPDDHALDYVAQFLRGVAKAVHDSPLEQAATALADRRAAGEPPGSETANIAALIQERLTQKIAI